MSAEGVKSYVKKILFLALVAVLLVVGCTSQPADADIVVYRSPT